jgi:uncharacterized phage protein (TIGR02220 family)
MSDQGWVCFYRKIKTWEWYSTPNMLHILFHLIVSANHKDGKWQGVDVKRGQLITGRKAISVDTGISEQSVRTCLTRLERTGEITQKSTNKFSIITVCNYDDYQTQENPTNQQLTSNQPATNQQLTTNNNVNNITKNKDNVGQKPRQQIPYKKIIDFFNEVTGKDFKHSTNGTKSQIRARFAEGFTIDDFKTVIQGKFDEWKCDEKMEQYIRPTTLFGTKFESYLQATQESGEHRKSKWVKNA